MEGKFRICCYWSKSETTYEKDQKTVLITLSLFYHIKPKHNFLQPKNS